jgi:hypothetical protein
MRRYLALITTIVIVLGLLLLLNAASHVAPDRPTDTEFNQNRSSLNTGTTGTYALYEFLQERGYKVIRWRQRIAALNSKQANRPNTFIIVGSPRVGISPEEMLSLLSWVSGGGRLVIIDRHPPLHQLSFPTGWNLTSSVQIEPTSNFDTSTEDLAANVSPSRPVQPTLLTTHIDSVLPSRYGARFKLNSYNEVVEASKEKKDEDVDIPEEISDQILAAPDLGIASSPLVHIADEQGAILIDYAYGAGRVVLLSDPFIVANNGIDRADNLQLALNIAGNREELIAFDEYHQGFGTSSNQLATYFAGTPVLPILGQLILIVIVVVVARGQRFGRPTPAPRVDRRSKLEFITSMAEVQLRARAYDLAIENIYTRTRRALARFGGVNYNDSRSRIAEAVAARSGIDQRQLDKLMRDCEAALNEANVSGDRALKLISQLRKLENQLKLQLRSREIKQAKL